MKPISHRKVAITTVTILATLSFAPNAYAVVDQPSAPRECVQGVVGSDGSGSTTYMSEGFIGAAAIAEGWRTVTSAQPQVGCVFPEDEPQLLVSPKPAALSSEQAIEILGLDSIEDLGLGQSPMFDSRVEVPRATGKLFYTDWEGIARSCSAFPINTTSGTLIATAAHCLNNGGENWSSSVSYSPAFINGQEPFGRWDASTFVVPGEWYLSMEPTVDYAIIKLAPRNGATISSVTGASGFTSGQSTVQENVRVWGWPAEPPYDGQVPYFCTGNTTANASFAQMNCALTGGASGGPWWLQNSSDNSDALGIAFTLTVFGDTTNGTIWGPPFRADVLNGMISSIGG